MATTYTPDPTATQAPASAPDPDDFPLESLPVDGDDLNSASVLQAFKVLGDFVAWMKSPRAVANALTQNIRTYRNAILQSRFLINRMGFPAGDIQTWQENWIADNFPIVSAAGNGAFGSYHYTIAGANAPGISVAPADGFSVSTIPHKWSSRALLATGASGGGASDSILLQGRGNVCVRPDGGFFKEWTHTFHGAVTDIAMGFTLDDLSGAASSASFTGINPLAAAFISDGSHWLCYTKASGGSSTSPSSGVASTALNTRQKFKISTEGLSVSDNSAPRIVFYINDAVVRDVAVDLNGTSSNLFPAMSFFRKQANAVSQSSIGPVRIGANLT